MTMHCRPVGIAHPPEVQPVGVNLFVISALYTSLLLSHMGNPYLMICDHDQTLWESALYPTVRGQTELASHRGITANPDRGGCPPVSHGGRKQPKRLFGQGHVGIVEVAVDPVERRSEELRDVNPGKSRSDLAPCPFHIILHLTLYKSSRNRR